jgi:hypothetical protein
MKQYYICILLFLLISEIGLPYDSLPPLPDPFDVKLKLTIPEEKLSVIDTAEISLLGGLAWSPHKLNFGYPTGGEATIPVRFQNKFLLFYGNYLSDLDYEIFHSFSARILSNIPIRTSFFLSSLSFERKSRFSAYFENVSISNWSAHSVFFGVLNPKFTFRFSRFFRSNHNYFYYFNLQNDCIIPTFLGNIDLAGGVLTQSNTSFIGFANLSDHIILNELNFLKPKITWWFADRNLMLGADFGTRIGKTLTIFQFTWNDKQITNLDTLYADAGPFGVNEALKYPTSNWSIKTSVRIDNQEINLSLRADTNQIHYVRPESLLYPENSRQRSKLVSIELKNSVGIFKNRLISEFDIGELSLVPVFRISNYLTLLVKNFVFNFKAELLGMRKFVNRDLEPNFRLNSDFTYCHSFFKLRLGCNNILGSGLEIYPDHLDNNRKIFLELLVTKTF